eukprot:3226220-Rhodomonas_salina.2
MPEFSTAAQYRSVKLARYGGLSEVPCAVLFAVSLCDIVGSGLGSRVSSKVSGGAGVRGRRRGHACWPSTRGRAVAAYASTTPWVAAYARSVPLIEW